MVKRNMIHTKRMPEMLSDVTVQPIMFVLLFAFVFGASIATGGGASYREFLLPGIQAQTIVFTAFVVASGITADVEKGIIDRFRSLPISRSSVLDRAQCRQPHPLVARCRGDGGDRAGDRLADPRRCGRGGAGVRADPGVRLRNDLVRHPHRIGDAVCGGGERCDVHRAVPDHVPGQHLRPDRADAALAAGDRGMEPGVVAGAGHARAVGQRWTRAGERPAAAAPSGARDDRVVLGADGDLRAVRAARLRPSHRGDADGSARGRPIPPTISVRTVSRIAAGAAISDST